MLLLRKYFFASVFISFSTILKDFLQIKSFFFKYLSNLFSRSLLYVLSFSIFVFFNFTLVFLSRSVLKSVFLQIDYFFFKSSCLTNLFWSSFLSYNIYLCYHQFLIFFSKHCFSIQSKKYKIFSYLLQHLPESFTKGTSRFFEIRLFEINFFLT